MKQTDGGPAFPIIDFVDGKHVYRPGISKLEYFAAALAPLMENGLARGQSIKVAVESVYDAAEVMLAESERRNHGKA